MDAELAALERVVARTTRRMRLQRALAYAATALTLGSASLALWQGGLYASRSTRSALPAWVALAALVALASVLGGCRRARPEQAAEALDRSAGLRGRVQAARAFAALPIAARTPFMEAAVRDACRRVGALSPAHAAPLRFPRVTPWAILALLACVGTTCLPRRTSTPAGAPVSAPRALHPLLPGDELARARAALAGWQAEARAGEPLLATARAYEAVLAQLAAGTIARDAAIDALLQREAEARAEMEAPAERAPGATDGTSEPDGLADASERAVRVRALERLLREGTSADGATLEPQLLTQARRELARLLREQAAADAADRTLSRLARDRSAMQDDASRDPGADGPGARPQARALAQELAQVRELLQRTQTSGAGDEGDAPGDGLPRAAAQAARTTRFQQRARGEHEAPEARAADAGPDVALAASGEGQAERMERAARVAREVRERVEVHAVGIGREHDPRRLDTPTAARAALETRRLDAAPRAAGPTRREVIGSAAGAGFAHAAYERVYGDYREHAEALLEREQVPASERYYVARYFALVRPRGPQEGAP